MVKHAQAICWLLSTNCLSVFDHFVRLSLKGLSNSKMFYGKQYVTQHKLLIIDLKIKSGNPHKEKVSGPALNMETKEQITKNKICHKNKNGLDQNCWCSLG